MFKIFFQTSVVGRDSWELVDLMGVTVVDKLLMVLLIVLLMVLLMVLLIVLLKLPFNRDTFSG